MKVNLICIGAQKAGTTTLYNLLKKHPDVSFSRYKEVHFFNTDNFNKGINYYHRLFTKSNSKYFADITPGYIAHPKVSKRIFDYNPDVKILVILRNPVQRAYSNYQMHVRNNKEHRSFEECINDEIEILKDGLNELNFEGYLARGLYSQQLDRYLQLFDKDNIKVILFEELISNQQETMNEIFSFLALPNILIESNIKSNEHYEPRFMILQKIFYQIPYLQRRTIISYIPKTLKHFLKKTVRMKIKKEPIKEATYHKLCNFFLEDINKLEQIIQLDLSLWKNC